jgi:hypothetical protein
MVFAAHCTDPVQPPLFHVTCASAWTLPPLPAAAPRGGQGTGRLLQPAAARDRPSEIRSARMTISTAS